jgi:HAD superfamily phosphoserine phosphatase-like hydrolase
MRSIILADMDNTLCDGFSYFDLLTQQVDQGIIEPAILAGATSLLAAHKNGSIAYEETITGLLNIYAAGLKGKSYTEVAASTAQFYANTPIFYDYVTPLFDRFRSTHDLYLVTGEPQFVAEAVVDRFSLDGYCATEYEVDNGIFTGGVINYLALRHEKLTAVQKLLGGHSLTDSIALGDAEGDIEMLGAVEHPICVNPNAGLIAYANQKNWPISNPENVLSIIEATWGV